MSRTRGENSELLPKPHERAKMKSVSGLYLLLAIAFTQIVNAAQAPGQTAPSKEPGVSTRRIVVTNGITVPYPSNWSPSAAHYPNAQELVTPPPDEKREVIVRARILITTEQRRDHQEALRRLAEIEVGVRTETTFLEICGWPAIQRRYRAPIPVPEKKDGNEISRMGLWQTTAIASGKVLIRLEATIAPDADEILASQAEAIGRGTTCPPPDRPADTMRQIRSLRLGSFRPVPPWILRSWPDSLAIAVQRNDERGSQPPRDAAVTTGVGELEIGASATGLAVVVASNNGVSVSNDGGLTFPTQFGLAGFLPFPNQGDPSVAVGASGNFYVALLGLPTSSSGTTAACTVSVSSSGNNGASFSAAGTAAFCPFTSSSLCFPDQEHVAADAITRAPGGGDQVYAVWRNFMGSGSNCNNVQGNVTPMISCSTNAAGTFVAGSVIGQGDRPRITVGSDGFVYVVYLDNNNLMLHKFSSCTSGLAVQTGFPVTVATLNLPTCPVAGLDRCDGGPLASPTVAVDDTDPTHIYVAFAQKSASSGDDILVTDSVDGGVHWTSSTIVSSTTASARRFMPWTCAIGGTAFVSWYDRGAATAAKNDLTDFFRGGALVKQGRLTPIARTNLTTTPDPQCTLWAPVLGGPLGSGPRAQADSETCSTQPQNASFCQKTPAAGSSGTACDFSTPSCPTGETCSTGGGIPKYGDYNGIACAGGRVVTAWASATAPPGAPSPGTAIGIFNNTLALGVPLLTVTTILTAGDPGRFNLLVDGVTVASNIGSHSVAVPGLASQVHGVDVIAAAGTNLSDYRVVFGGDCPASGMIGVFIGNNKVCEIYLTPKVFASCQQQCTLDEGACMAQTHTFAERQQCAKDAQNCKKACGSATVTVVKTLAPSGDPGRFNLLVDGATKATNVGDGDATAPIPLSVGMHSVTETAAAGTNLGSYTAAFSGDCDAAGKVSLNYGDDKTCVVTNTGAPRPPQLTVIKVLFPSGDPGMFDLRIDGVTRAPGIGDGGSTGPQVLAPGTHTVSEVGSGVTSLNGYHASISGDCNSNGSVTLTVGDNKTCTITNTAKVSRATCLAACTFDRDECMANVGQPGEPSGLACAQEFTGCKRLCPP